MITKQEVFKIESNVATMASEIEKAVGKLKQYIYDLEKEYPEVNDYFLDTSSAPVSALAKDLDDMLGTETDFGFEGGYLYQVADLFHEYLNRQR